MSSYFSTTPAYLFEQKARVVDSTATAVESPEESAVEVGGRQVVEDVKTPDFQPPVESKLVVQKTVGAKKMTSAWADSFYATPDFGSLAVGPGVEEEVVDCTGDGPAEDVQKLHEEWVEKANRARAEFEAAMTKVEELKEKLGGKKVGRFDQEKVEPVVHEVKNGGKGQAESTYFGLPNDCVHAYNRQPAYQCAYSVVKSSGDEEGDPEVCESIGTAADLNEFQQSAVGSSASSVYHFHSLRDEYKDYEVVEKL